MNKQRAAKRILALCMACVLLVFAVGAQVPVLANGASSGTSQEQLDEANRKLAEIRQRQKELEAQIAAGQNAAEAARERKALLEQEAALLETQITAKVQEIETKEQEIADKQAEIVDKQKELDENDRLFRQRLVAIYKMNDASVLSTLLSVDSFADFLVVAKSLQVISQHDIDLLEKLEAQRVDLETAKAEMETLLTDLETERAELEVKLDEYNKSIKAAQAQVSAAIQQVELSKEEMEKADAEYAQAQAELEKIWQDLSNNSDPIYIGGALGWPVPNFSNISSHFGNRTLYGRPNFHGGMDISSSGIYGATIVAANGGRVVKVVRGSNVGYGNYVIIDHGGGIKTLYGHCATVTVNEGQTVNRGDAIATVGSTGNSTGPHLHFELRLNNTVKTNPYPYLTGQKDL